MAVFRLAICRAVRASPERCPRTAPRGMLTRFVGATSRREQPQPQSALRRLKPSESARPLTPPNLSPRPVPAFNSPEGLLGPAYRDVLTAEDSQGRPTPRLCGGTDTRSSESSSARRREGASGPTRRRRGRLTSLPASASVSRLRVAPAASPPPPGCHPTRPSSRHPPPKHA
ncbi:hypothetical protein DAEQUDRAFT_137583 [Daedalea quercina L-15889]|uniref:Uncharacterized protein n=1 Tax=Daedalea quercina L-15889 TaxID=1314783 RepID=A0A165RSS6_9APHY|nr:hypothetical protein DAEQUDRAFT_137583 [Daedalea quercina L-15889]